MSVNTYIFNECFLAIRFAFTNIIVEDIYMIKYLQQFIIDIYVFFYVLLVNIWPQSHLVISYIHKDQKDSQK